jgi:hypothetical protein
MNTGSTVPEYVNRTGLELFGLQEGYKHADIDSFFRYFAKKDGTMYPLDELSLDLAFNQRETIVKDDIYIARKDQADKTPIQMMSMSKIN